MLVAVLAVMLTATIGSSNADSCTASLPAVVIRGEDECPVLRGGKIMDENVSALLQEVVRYNYLVNSCAKLAEKTPNSPSGNYWILNSTDSPVQVFREMGEAFPANLTVARGWMRVANLNVVHLSYPTAHALVVEHLMGPDYYCESGLNAPPWRNVVYCDDPLWDGQGCNGLKSSCCDPLNLPCFCKKLPEQTTDDLEFCICGDASRNSEDTPIELVELYIQ